MFKIMIVDDMEITRKEIKRLKLWGEKTGFIIWEEAKNGYEALLKLEVNPVDMVITDIKMPKINGLELLQKIIVKNYCSCVILMSDYSDFNYVRQGLVLGAFDYMVKPVEEGELNKILERAKEFIIGKKEQEDRLIKMENYFPKADIEMAVQFICTDNSNVFQFMSLMVDRMGATLNYDFVKIGKLLKDILIEIGRGIFENFIWFKKFFDINDIVKIDFSQCEDFDSVKFIFLDFVEKCIFMIDKLQCGRLENNMVKEVCKCVLENVESDISLKIVANNLYMNKTYISEAFKQKTGISFLEYLNTVKMERAIKLITEGDFKVYEIGNRLGFKDIEYFSKLFKIYTGLTPTKFRQNIR